MDYDEDRHLLTHNTFGDRFELWHDGDRIVTTDLDGEELFTTVNKLPSVEAGQELLIRALAHEVMLLERVAESLREEIASLDANLLSAKE